MLAATYQQAATAAMMCDFNDPSQSCQNTIPDECGCDQPAGSNAAANQSATDAYNAWSGSCPQPSGCEICDLMGCDMGTCSPNGTCVGGC